jgi:hypothetical protein
MKKTIIGFALSQLIGAASLANEPFKPGEFPAVAGIVLGRQLSSYPSCDAPESADKICVGLKLGDQYVLTYQPEFPHWALTAPFVSVDATGKIIAVVSETKGIEVQDELLKELISMYGKPASLKRSPIQNRFGAKFEKIDATWVLKWGDVAFEGVTDNLDEGSLVGNLR